MGNKKDIISDNFLKMVIETFDECHVKLPITYDYPYPEENAISIGSEKWDKMYRKNENDPKLIKQMECVAKLLQKKGGEHISANERNSDIRVDLEDDYFLE